MEQLVISDGTDTATLVPFREHWTLTLDVPDGEAERRQRLLEAAAQALSREGGGRIEYWVRGAGSDSDRVPLAAGFTPYRDLWRLARPLPALASGLTTRAYTPADAEEFLDVNNRAFDWHPEQGGMTAEELAERQEEAWYDPDGFRILEEEGRLVGFCWTKVHDDPPVGEIYVVAVDPEVRGRGLGRELVLAGLEWLSGRGLRRAMLYVESDNRPANRVYADLGFEHDRTDRAYQRTLR